MALTSTYDKNTKTLTVTKSAAGDTLDYAATVQGAEANGATFGSDVTVINATKASKNIAVNLLDGTRTSSSLTSLTLGKGADEITVAGSALSITTGAGKDTLTLTSETSKITITDFDAKNDAIILGAGMSTVLPTATFSGADLTLTFTDTGTEKATHTFTLTGGKDKKITIANSTGAVIWEQSFQAAGDAEYNFDNNNTGKVLTTDAAYVAGTNRSQAITLNLTGNDQVVLGGKGNDTVVTTVKDGYYEIAGGKGNDTFVIASETEVHLTDYTLGGKEVIQLGEGLSSVVGHRTVGDNVYITLAGGTTTPATATAAAKYERTSIVVVEKGRWDQIANESKKSIKIVDASGQEIVTKGFQDQSEAVIKTVPKATKQAPTANHLDFTEASDTFTLATGTGSIDAKQVNYITVSPSTPASIKAGQTYMVITGGGGKDTLIGADKEVENAVNTAYVTVDQVTYGTKDSEDYSSTGDTRFVKVKVKNTDGTFTELKLGIANDSNGSTTYHAQRVTVTILDTDGTTQLASGAYPATNTTNSLATTDAGKEIKLEAVGTATTTFKTFVIPKSIARLAANKSFTAIDGTAVAKFANATAGLEYTYSYASNSVTLDGGKGNDYLMSGNAGANLYGGVGNDTLRGTSGAGVMYGGAGNDVFLLTGEGATLEGTANDNNFTYTEGNATKYGKYQTHTIKDYYSGAKATYETVAADANARKKAYGSDKIQIAFDKYNTKAPVAKATLIGGTFDGNTLTLTVEGQSWVDSVAAGGVDGTSSVAAHFFGDAGIANSSDTSVGADLTSKYAITAKEGDVLTIVDQGITYKQTLEAFDATNSEVKVTANYLGKVNDAVKVINGAGSKKAMRLVAGAQTESVIGGDKVDTLVGNGSAELTGGNGNDIFLATEGDTIADYSAAKGNSDKILVSSLNYLSRQKNTGAGAVTIAWDPVDTTNKQYVGTFKVGEEATADKIVVKYYEDNGSRKVESISYDSGKYKVSNLPGVDTSSEGVTNITGAEYAVDENGLVARATNTITADGNVNIGGFTINASTGAITFQQVTETPVYNAKKGTYASTKKVTDTMIRTFSTADTASVVSGGASTYLEVFAGLDDKVVAIKGGNKAARIVNSGKHVSTILGGAKAETISVGNYTADENHTDTIITVTSGKGNDVIEWNGNQAAVITDYTTAKFNNKGKMTAGDVLYFTNLDKASDVKVAGFYGNDVVLTSDGTGNVTLTGAKDRNAVFAVGKYTVADTIGAAGAENFATVSLADPHEYLLAKKDQYAATGVQATDDASKGTSETWVINAAASTKANTIDASASVASKVGTIYGGKGVDVITAGTWGSTADDKNAVTAYHGLAQLIDAGAGNDVIYANSSGTTVNVATGAGTDIIAVGSDTNIVNISDYTAGTDKLWLLNDMAISNVETVSPADSGRETTVAGGTKKNPTTINLVDIRATLTGGGTGERSRVVTFQDIKDTNLKITRLADNATVPSSKNFFSLDYLNSKIEIGAKDFAANTAVDLDGANATDITVAKAAKKVTIEGAQNGAVVSVENGGKNAITFKGNDYGPTNATHGATYNGGAGADVYYAGGLNASDTVVLGSGNDSILSGGKAHVVSGIGNNVFVLGTGDAYNIDKFSTTDKVVLASTTTLDSVSYNSDTKALVITTSEEVTAEGGIKNTVTGAITLNDYKAGSRVNIYQLGTNARGKAAVNAELVRSYGQETLTLAKGDSSTIIISDKTDGSASATNSVVTTKVDATNLGANAIISDTTSNVTTFVGSAKNDTIYAFDKADTTATTLTGGAGNDVFYLDLAKAESGDSVAKYIITDYGTGKDEIRFNTDDTLKGTQLAAIADYSANYSISGGDIIITDTGIELTIQNGTGKTITLGTNKVTFSDPVNVKLAKNATEVDWSGTAYDTSRVETFDASANTKDAIKFTATGTNFTAFTGNKKGSTVVIGDANAKGATVDLGSAGGALTLNTNTTLADTVKYSGGNITVTNFGTNDVLNGVEGITAATVTLDTSDATKSNVKFTIKSNTVDVTGAGVTVEFGAWTKSDSLKGGTDTDSDTAIYTYTKTVKVGGVSYQYGIGTSAYLSTAPADTSKAAYWEKVYTADNLISYGDTIYSGQEGDNQLADITEAKVAVDITSTTNPEVDYGTGDVITFSSVVDKTKQK